MPTSAPQTQSSQALITGIPLTDIPQGPGSTLDSDTVDGFHAAPTPQPNTLLPLGSTSQFPISVLPVSGGGGSGFLVGNGAATDKHMLIADGTLWQSRAISGDITIAADTGTINLVASGVTAATYGDTTHYPIIVVDAKGRITSASNQSVSSSAPGGNNGDVQYKSGSSFAGSDSLFWDNTDGYLGIGTTSPICQLDIRGAGDQLLEVINTNGGTTSDQAAIIVASDHNYNVEAIIKAVESGSGLGVVTYGSAVNAIFIDAGISGQAGTPATYITFRTANASAASTEKVRIDHAGNVGIGTMTPAALLEVNGTAQFDSTIQVSGDTTGSGTVTSLGTNCPAGTLTSPYTWIKLISHDGSTVWLPAYK